MFDGISDICQYDSRLVNHVVGRTYLFQECRHLKGLIVAARPQAMVDNKRRERQSFTLWTLAQLVTQSGKSHRVNATTDSKALTYGQLVYY
jgi:hypothetical protein